MVSRMAGLVAGAMLLIGAWAGEAWGQTELGGAIWGELVPAGNPHIVVDSTWVPEGRRLSLAPGVEVVFNESQGLHIFGELTSSGAQYDSVLFCGITDTTHWAGLRFYNRRSVTMDFTWIRCPDTAVFLDQGYSLTMNDCWLNAGVQGIRAFRGKDGPMDGTGWSLVFKRSFYEGGRTLRIMGSSLTVDSCYFNFQHGEIWGDPGFYAEGTTIRLTNSDISGGGVHILGRPCVIEDCRFTIRDDRREIHVATTEMRRTFVNGTCSLGSGGVYHNIIPFEDNTVTGMFGGGNAAIRGCTFGFTSSFGPEDTISIKRSVFAKSLLFSGRNASVNIDSCYIAYEPGITSLLNIGELRQLLITRSVLGCSIVNYVDAGIIFDHNTFYLSDPDVDNNGLMFFATDTIPVFTNNIFLNTGYRGALFSFMQEGRMPIFEYNCVWGFAAYGIWPDSIGFGDDSTNLIINPLIEHDGFSCPLAPNSPCIDRGDPNALEDIDGTRSDMGYRSFYQADRAVARDNETCTPSAVNLSAFPSPFNSSLSISYSSPTNAPLLLSLVDLSGRTLQQNWFPGTSSGKGVATIGAVGLPSGNYFVIVGGKANGAVLPVRCLK